MNRYLMLILVILFFSCQRKQEKVIDSINILYHNGIFERVEAISCDEIVYIPLKNKSLEFLEDGTAVPMETVILDTTIRNKEIIEEIENEIKFFKKEKDYGIDARMKCYINFSNDNTDSLCIGQNPNYGYYNDKPTRFTNKFVYLIRKNCGFYKWIHIRAIQSFEELNDTTFIREKVISSTGEEY